MRPPTTHARPSRHLLAVTSILTLGAGLRLVQYLASSSLWIDELFIALNVTRRGWTDLLFGPLDYNQVAPIGFLALEKLATSLLGPTEVALRFFPTLFSLVSLVLCWRLFRRFLSGGPLLAALTLVAINPVLLWTARNAKQYSGDVMVTLLLLLLALRFREGRDDTRSAAVAGAVGGAAILLSQPAVLVALCLCAFLLIQRLRMREPIRPVAILGLGGALGAGAVTATSLILSPAATRTFMREGWRFMFLAPPQRDPFSLPRLLFRYVAYFFGGMIPNNWPEIMLTSVLLALAVVGGWHLARRRPQASALLAAPLIVAIAASAARLLPFSGRVSAYLGTSLIVALAAGIGVLRDRLPGRVRSLGFAAAMCLVAIPALAQLLLMPPLYRREDARPVLEEVRARWRPGDILYVIGGVRAMEFYGEPMGLTPWIGKVDPGFARRDYVQELNDLRGRSRVWFFHTHADPCQPEAVLSYLNAIGTQVERIEDPNDNRGKREAAAYLYDLSDPSRSARSGAANQPLPAAASDCDRTPESQQDIIRRKLRDLIRGMGE